MIPLEAGGSSPQFFPSHPYPLFHPCPSIPAISGVARKCGWGLSIPLPFLPLPLPLEIGPHIAARGSGGALKLPQRMWAEPGRQTVFGAF